MSLSTSCTLWTSISVAHVDDLLVVGDYSFIELQLLPVLKEKYKISTELMREPGSLVMR